MRAGGRVAIGSDAPAVPYGLGVHYDLGLIAAAGLPNDQALRIATAEGALALGLERQIGTLEDGKIADFVVIDGDPLERLVRHATDHGRRQGGCLDRSGELAREPLTLSDRFTSALGRGSRAYFGAAKKCARRKNSDLQRAFYDLRRRMLCNVVVGYLLQEPV